LSLSTTPNLDGVRIKPDASANKKLLYSWRFLLSFFSSHVSFKPNWDDLI
jgi:hypothetical protein